MKLLVHCVNEGETVGASKIEELRLMARSIFDSTIL